MPCNVLHIDKELSKTLSGNELPTSHNHKRFAAWAPWKNEFRGKIF